MTTMYCDTYTKNMTSAAHDLLDSYHNYIIHLIWTASPEFPLPGSNYNK